MLSWTSCRSCACSVTTCKRVLDPDPVEAAEIAVAGVDDADAVLAHQGGDVGVGDVLAARPGRGGFPVGGEKVRCLAGSPDMVSFDQVAQRRERFGWGQWPFGHRRIGRK